MRSSDISVAFLIADYGQDPTETVIPYEAFKKAGFQVTFITENGGTPECDAKMLTGVTGAILGAPAAAKQGYQSMIQTPEWKSPLSWSNKELSLKDYDLLFLPGGHEKTIKQLLDNPRAQQLVADYWPLTKKPGKKCCAAICHGVQLLAHTKVNGKSVLYDATTTALVSSSKDYVISKQCLG